MGWDCFVFFNLLGLMILPTFSWSHQRPFFDFLASNEIVSGVIHFEPCHAFFLLLGGVNLLVFFHMLNRNIQIASMKPSIWPHCWWPVPFLLIHSIISIHVRVFLPVFMLNTFNPTFFLVQKMCYPSIPSAGRGNGGGNNGSDRKGTHLLYGKRASAASDLLGRSSGAGKGWKCWNASFTTYKWIYK